MGQCPIPHAFLFLPRGLIVYKKLLIALIVFMSSQAHAIKSFVGITDRTPIGSATVIIDSKQAHYASKTPDRDVIACQGNGQLCYANSCRGTSACTPYQFARESGYTWVHTRSVVISGENQYVVMEVSNDPPPAPNAKVRRR